MRFLDLEVTAATAEPGLASPQVNTAGTPTSNDRHKIHAGVPSSVEAPHSPGGWVRRPTPAGQRVAAVAFGLAATLTAAVLLLAVGR